MDSTLIQYHIPKYQQIQYHKYKTKFNQGYLWKGYLRKVDRIQK
jgi:hypothetical protein